MRASNYFEGPEVFDIKAHHRAKAKGFVDIVKEDLARDGIDVPFYIAGGSIFSTFTGGCINDIDVYFYTKEDLEAVVNGIRSRRDAIRTPNAITHQILTPMSSIKEEFIDLSNTAQDLEPKSVQYIVRQFGQPYEVFKTFDLSCSEIGFSSDHQFLCSDRFSRQISVNFENFTSMTYGRILKYANNKNAGLLSKTLHEAIDYLAQNAFKKIPPSYNEEDATPLGYEILGTSITMDHNPSLIHSAYKALHDFQDGDDLIQIFSKINTFSGYIHHDKASPEYIISNLMGKETETDFVDIMPAWSPKGTPRGKPSGIEDWIPGVTKEQITEAINLYPEYMI